MEFLCQAPTHNFPNNSKFPTICPSGHNTKTSRSRVRPLAVPLKISQLISSFNPFEPEVSSLRSLENIEPGELIVNNPTGGDKDDIQYFLDMLSTPVYDVAVESPLQQSMNISERLGVNFYMKREDRQSVFSFKLRGAYNMMSKLPDDQLSKGVITASAGNHAMGVALSAQKLKSSATIVMPVTTPEFKREAVENTGATVILRGNTFDEAHEYAMTMSQDEDLTFIPPYDHPDIIKGQGTIGAEISRQFSKPVHAIFVPIGGGGLAAGIATYMKQVSPSTKIIGVEPYGACSMALSLSNGARVKLENVDNFADGVAVGLVGEEPFRICKNLIDGMVLVDRDAISATIKDVYDEEKNILETSGALAIAGAEAYCKYYNIKNENIVAIASGANMDFSKFKSIMDLANIGAKKEALLATFMPEEPGSFKRFTQLVGSINITEFKYRFNSERKRALVLYSVDVPEKSELEEMLWRMESSEMHTVNLSNNNLVNDHLRHLIGGRSHPRHEILCQFIFPEKPGALRKFVDAFSPRWNITLFHYRDQGEVDASVLVGFQVQKWEMGEFQYHVNNLGYPYEIEIHNEAYKLIME